MSQAITRRLWLIWLLAACALLGGQWRDGAAMAQDEAALSALVEKLAAAKTADEQEALMAAEPELKTAALVQALRAKGAALSRGANRDLRKAIFVLELARSVAEKINDRPGLDGALHSLASAHNLFGNVLGSSLNPAQRAEALTHFQTSLRLYQTLNRQDWIARLLYNIGVVHQNRGEEAEALKHYRESLQIGQAHNYQDIVAANRLSIGAIQADQGDLALGMDNLRASLALFDQQLQAGLSAEQSQFATGKKAEALHSLGIAHQLQSNLELALKCYQESLSLSGSPIHRGMRASNLHNIGSLQLLLGEYEQAQASFNQALAAYRAIFDQPGIAQTLNGLGILTLEQKQYDDALRHFTEALRISEALGDLATAATIQANLGNLHAERNDPAQGDDARALERYQKSLDLSPRAGRKGSEAFALYGLSHFHQRRSRHDEAVGYANRAIESARQAGVPDTEWRARLVAGQAHRALNQLSQAREQFLDSAAIIEKIRTQVPGDARHAQQYFEDKTEPYRALVELAVTQNNLPEALGFAERIKARTLLDILQSRRADITKKMTLELRQQERQLADLLTSAHVRFNQEMQKPKPDQGRLESLKAALEKQRRDYEKFQFDISPGLKVLRGEAPPLSVAEAGQLLPDAQHALLEFVVTDKQTFLFVLTRNPDATKRSLELKVYQPSQPLKREELARLVEDFRLLMEKSDNLFRQPARKLYDLLLAPAREQLKHKTTLVIAPDGPLWELPFQALMPTPDRYLVEDAAIFYVPSLTAQREMAKARRGKAARSQTLLAIGNPTLGGAQLKLRDQLLGPLPQAEKEVRGLQKLYGAGRAKIYVGPEAREETIKAEAGRYDILHFAAHAVFNNRNPMYSTIVLAQPGGAAPEDGMLEAWEMMKLDLRAEQVLLPACETARGRIGAGEGVIGLTWALFVAGAPTTVVSQWKVRDDATAELMAEYHRQLQKGGAPVSKAQALRQASLKLLQNKLYGHPHFWAGFALVGDGF